jgi:hypothetical protein
MLLCDQCQRGWHMACLRPPLTFLPFGQWSCPRYRGSLVLGVWCFNQLYSMAMWGFHHHVRENEEWWFRNAIKHEMVELIHWNLMA